MTNVITHPYAYEAFSLSHAEANGRDIYGVRFYKIMKLDDRTFIEINTGYVQKDDLENGPVELHLPSKDETGSTVYTLIVQVDRVVDWKIVLQGSPDYRRAHEFTYRGEITWNSGSITLKSPDDTLKVLTKNVFFEPGVDKPEQPM